MFFSLVYVAKQRKHRRRKAVACLPPRLVPVPVDDDVMLVGSIQYVVHLGFYAPGKDDVQRNIPLPREVNVRSWHDFVSLRATCDARPGETQQAMPR